MSRITNYSRSLAEVAQGAQRRPGAQADRLLLRGVRQPAAARPRHHRPEAEEDDDNVAFGQSYFVDSDQRFGNTSLQGDVNRMLDEFRRADCVIQAVDIGGLRAGADAAGPAERRGGALLHRQRDRRRAVQGRQQPARAAGAGARADQRHLPADLRALGPQDRRRLPPAAGEGEAAAGSAADPPRRLLRAAPVQAARSAGEEPPRLGRHRQRHAAARPRAQRPRRRLPRHADPRPTCR